MEEFVKLLGFDSLNQYNKLVFTTDVSTPEKLAAFEKWQEEDGTKEGLLRLRGEVEESSVTLRRSRLARTPGTNEEKVAKIFQKEIILIDDKPYGLQQIKNAIPRHKKGEYKLLHFSTFSDYQDHIKHKVWMVLVDFSLDLDKCYGSHIASQIDAEIIIGFSSKMWGSEVIIEAIEQQRKDSDMPQLFAIEKLKETDHNEELEKLFNRIFR
jgi:hypothetical protein